MRQNVLLIFIHTHVIQDLDGATLMFPVVFFFCHQTPNNAYHTVPPQSDGGRPPRIYFYVRQTIKSMDPAWVEVEVIQDLKNDVGGYRSGPASIDGQTLGLIAARHKYFFCAKSCLINATWRSPQHRTKTPRHQPGTDPVLLLFQAPFQISHVRLFISTNTLQSTIKPIQGWNVCTPL